MGGPVVRPQPQPDGGPDFGLQLVGKAIALAALVFVLPALLVAAPLGYVVDRRGWRRWPGVACGVVASAVALRAGAEQMYVDGWAELWRLAHQGTGQWTGVASLLALGVPAGVVTGPVLPTVLLHRDEDQLTRHRRELSARRRSRVQACRRITSGRWPEMAGRTVLGLSIGGRVDGWTVGLHRRYVAPPVDVWQRQAVIVGETGAGKTVTALAIAAGALRAGWHVYWVDGKSDAETSTAFVAAADAAHVAAVDGGALPLDGWRGGPEAVVNRLLATQVFTEPYYEGVARTVLRAAVAAGAPASMDELVRRIDKTQLMRGVRDDPAMVDVLRHLPDREVFGVRARYEGIAWAVGSALDGSWSYEDVRAAYVPVGQPENRTQAAEVGAFMLEDLLHWAIARKDRSQPALVIVDEFSKLSARPGAAVDLIERVRACNVGVVLIGQTWASLGPDEAVRQRVAGTVGTVIVHQLKQPDEVAGLAGTEWTLEHTEQTAALTHTGVGSRRAGHRYVVHPDEVRSLPRGEAFVIHGGRAVRVVVRRAGAPAAGSWPRAAAAAVAAVAARLLSFRRRRPRRPLTSPLRRPPAPASNVIHLHHHRSKTHPPTTHPPTK